MKRLSKVNEANPDLINDEVIGNAIEADRLQELVTIAKSPEGQTLIKTLVKDYILKAQQLHGLYKDGTHEQLVTRVASMEATWDLALLLASSEILLKSLDEELNDALTE